MRGLWMPTALVVGVVAFACHGGPTTPSSPQDGEGQASPTVPNVTGTVFEFGFGMAGERRPVPSLRLKVQTRDARGRVSYPDIVTDRNGRFAVSSITTGTGSVWFETAAGSEYKFVCSSYPMIEDRFRPPTPPGFPFDFSILPVVHASWSGDGPPPGMLIPGASMFGRVSERLGDALRPVAGATVSIDDVTTDPATTAGNGFYMICTNAGSDQVITITVRKPGYRTISREILNERAVDFELVRD